VEGGGAFTLQLAEVVRPQRSRRTIHGRAAQFVSTYLGRAPSLHHLSVGAPAAEITQSRTNGNN
jgi:hypothetical protein